MRVRLGASQNVVAYVVSKDILVSNGSIIEQVTRSKVLELTGEPISGTTFEITFGLLDKPFIKDASTPPLCIVHDGGAVGLGVAIMGYTFLDYDKMLIVGREYELYDPFSGTSPIDLHINLIEYDVINDQIIDKKVLKFPTNLTAGGDINVQEVISDNKVSFAIDDRTTSTSVFGYMLRDTKSVDLYSIDQHITLVVPKNVSDPFNDIILGYVWGADGEKLYAVKVDFDNNQLIMKEFDISAKGEIVISYGKSFANKTNDGYYVYPFVLNEKVDSTYERRLYMFVFSSDIFDNASFYRNVYSLNYSGVAEIAVDDSVFDPNDGSIVVYAQNVVYKDKIDIIKFNVDSDGHVTVSDKQVRITLSNKTMITGLGVQEDFGRIIIGPDGHYYLTVLAVLRPESPRVYAPLVLKVNSSTLELMWVKLIKTAISDRSRVKLINDHGKLRVILCDIGYMYYVDGHTPRNIYGAVMFTVDENFNTDHDISDVIEDVTSFFTYDNSEYAVTTSSYTLSSVITSVTITDKTANISKITPTEQSSSVVVYSDYMYDNTDSLEADLISNTNYYYYYYYGYGP